MTSPARKEVARAFGEALNEHLVGPPKLKRGNVAAAAQIARSHLYKLSRGHEVPSLTVLIGLADALGVHPIQLMQRFLKKLGRPDAE